MRIDTNDGSHSVDTGYLHKCVEDILNLPVGDRLAFSDKDAPFIFAVLRTRPLGGRRFQTYKHPDSMRTSVIRLPDEADGVLKEHERQMTKAQAQLDRETSEARVMANMRNAATMAQFEEDMKAYCEAHNMEMPEIEKPKRGFFSWLKGFKK